MKSESLLAFVAAAFSLVLAVAGLFWKRRNLASWCFAIGMAGLAADSLCSGFSLAEADLQALANWRNLGLCLKSILTATWLCFSVVYSRGDARESLRRWRLGIAASLLVPIALIFAFPTELIEALPRSDQQPETWLHFQTGAKAVNLIVLLGAVLVLMNLERTFRAAVGTMQWRIKFFILGLAVIFGARIYTRTQVLVFSGHSSSLTEVETISLLIGCALMAVGYLRSGFAEVDVYPSRAVLQTSITVLLAGGYLFCVGILAQVVAQTGGAGTFQLQAFLVLVGIALLAILLLSERLRQRVRLFVSRHFQRPHYDSRQVWTRFTRSTSSAQDDHALCAAAAKLISETFNIMSVSIWLYDAEKERLVLGASTARSRTDTPEHAVSFPPAWLAEVRTRAVIDIENVRQDWGKTLREISGTQFQSGGNRICLSLLAGERWLGAAILADRVRGLSYTVEESELLKCIADQIASNLLNLRLATEILASKEWEAFQTISAFFVHDLKNAASTLNLMLQNLPVHYDDPAFRDDALRGIGETTSRINQIIERLSSLRNSLELERSELDLNSLVEDAIHRLDQESQIEFNRRPVPKLLGDEEQLCSVITNLLLNARDATGVQGHIEVQTATQNGWVALSVSDDGCGMSPAFLHDSLFRPFKTTKKKGLGIGMFQSKMIVEAHRGSIRVQSEPGKGTTFEVLLPVSTSPE